MVCDCGASPDSVFAELGELICTSCGKVLEESGLSSDAPTGSGCLLASENETAKFRQRHNDWSKVEARVRDLASELKISSHCVQVAQSLMRKTLGTPRTGSVLERYAACCLLLATRRSREGSVLTLAEVSARVRCDPHAVSRCWRELLMSLSSECAGTDIPASAEGDADTTGRGAGSSLSSIDLAALVERHCEALRQWLSSSANASELPAPQSDTHKASCSQSCRHAACLFAPTGAARESARTLLWLAKREWLVEGRAPMQVSVAVVLLATQLHAHDEAAAVALRALKVETLLGLGEQQQAVRRRLAELKKVLVAAVRALPGRSTLKEAAALRVAAVALRQMQMQRAADDARANVSARMGALPVQGPVRIEQRREPHPGHLPSQHPNQHQDSLQHEPQHQHPHRNEDQDQDEHRISGSSSAYSCALDGESERTGSHAQAPLQHRLVHEQEAQRQDKRQRREEGLQLDAEHLNSHREEEQGSQQRQYWRHQHHRPSCAPEVQPQGVRAAAICERAARSRGFDPPAFTRAAEQRGRRALRLAAARERIARAPWRAESLSAERTSPAELADGDGVEPARERAHEGAGEAEDGAVDGTLDGRALRSQEAGAGMRGSPRMPELARGAAAEPVAEAPPPGASQGVAGAARRRSAGAVREGTGCGATGGTVAGSVDTLPAAAFEGELEREDVLIELALRRGVAEEAILQGFFSAATAREDRELRFEDAPRLFREELDEDDLPSEIVSQIHLRTEFVLGSGASDSHEAGQEIAVEEESASTVQG